MIAALLLALASNPCDSAQTQSDLDVCWAGQAKQADAQLNAAYKKAFADLRKLGIDPNVLVPVQLAWISARDKTCAFEESLSEGGSIAPMMYSECVDRMTRARTQRITDLVETLQGEGVVSDMQPASGAVDAELNRVYGLLRKQGLTASQSSGLVAAEVAWLSYRDKACKVEGGSCMDDLESERTAELEAGWLGEQFW
jgi:uncharacterized protein YecT (DUF1311 family)